MVSDYVAFMGHLIREEEERRLRVALRELLPRPLHWLIDHPKLLALYLKLPHRAEIVARCEYPYSVARYVVVRKASGEDEGGG